MDKREVVEITKNSFEKSFGEKSYYNMQTQDEQHLQRILSSLNIKPNYKILDLGTGSGYLAFPIAEQNETCEVAGLDIVVKALENNRDQAKLLGLDNLSFVNYDGIDFPFEDNTFDLIVTRYALHHFPDILKGFSEIKRVLKPGGRVFISDPTPNDDDDERFVDKFMQLSEDGHVQFYRKDEFIELANNVGLKFESSFLTEIRFPSSKRTEGYLKMEPTIDKKLIDSYDVKVIDGEVFITEKVLNICFSKE